MTDRTCSVDGCGRGGKLIRGLCNLHYKRLRRLGDPGEGEPRRHERPECSVEGCSSPHVARGYCTKHLKRVLRTGSTDGRVKAERICSIDGCGRKAEKRGWCGTHYQRWRMTGTTDDPEPATHCSKGHERTPANTYWTRDGKRQCRPCAAAFSKASWDRKSPEEQAELKRKWDQDYRGRDLERFKRQRARASRNFRLANPERYRAWHAARRAWKIQSRTDRVDYLRILDLYGMVCHICAGGIDSPDVLHFDHVIPLSRGGGHVEENIRPSHKKCNLRKGTKLMSELGAA